MNNKEPTESSAAPLIDYFQRLIPLNEAEKELVRARFQPRLYRKRQYLLQEGDICAHLYFVVRGCLRMYQTDEKGNTNIIQFAPENHWINDLGSFHGIKPARLTIDAIEDSVVLLISRDNLIDLFLSASKFDRIFRVLMENSYVRLQERLLQNISSTAQERYESFLENYPDMSLRLSQVQIASYLGITPEFLSRLRGRALRPSGRKKT